MAVKIKLRRMGKIRAPYYRIVVADSRTKRDGRAIDGHVHLDMPIGRFTSTTGRKKYSRRTCSAVASAPSVSRIARSCSV